MSPINWIPPYVAVAMIVFGWLCGIDERAKIGASALMLALCSLLWPLVILVSIGFAIGKFASKA